MTFALLLALSACQPSTVDVDVASTDTGDVVAPPNDPCADPSTCLYEGDNAFTSNGQSRDVQVRLPADPVGAPVVFVWHFLGGSPNEMLDWMGTDRLTAHGYIVIAPASRQLPNTEWLLLGSPEDNPDVALFDELLSRVTAQYGVDRGHVYATGFSAGGLFTTYLTMNRAEVLAATAPFSGGAPESSYTAPSTELPVMITWGGPGDSYGGFSFADASQAFAEALFADGHEVIECEHSSGHWLPSNAQAHVVSFFDDASVVPAGCTLVTE